MRPILLGPEVREMLTQLKAYARAHPLSLADLGQLKKRADDVAGRMLSREHYVVVPVGLEVGLTYEEQEAGMMWHASFTLGIKNKFPNEFAVAEILKILELPPLKEMADGQIFGDVVNFWFLDVGEEKAMAV